MNCIEKLVLLQLKFRRHLSLFEDRIHIIELKKHSTPEKHNGTSEHIMSDGKSHQLLLVRIGYCWTEISAVRGILFAHSSNAKESFHARTHEHDNGEDAQ